MHECKNEKREKKERETDRENDTEPLSMLSSTPFFLVLADNIAAATTCFDTDGAGKGRNTHGTIDT